MDPNNPFAKKLDLEGIAADGIRQQEMQQVVDNLDQIFDRDAQLLPVDRNLTYVTQKISHLHGMFRMGHEHSGMAQVSKPYESFTHAGVNLNSHIVKFRIEGSKPEYVTNYPAGNLYIIGLLADGQQTINENNLAAGMYKSDAGDRFYFKYSQNENFGQERGTSGHADDRELIAESLEPIEQNLLLDEFAKAIKTNLS